MDSLIRGIPVSLLTVDNSQARTWKTETVDNVLVAPYAETDGSRGLQPQGHNAVYHLAVPKTDTHRWEGALVQFFGSTWAVVGIPTQGIDALIPGPWNKKVLVELYHTSALDPNGLWADTVTLLRVLSEKDADGYDSGTQAQTAAVSAIFLQGITDSAEADADKRGSRKSAAVEIWEQDYNGEPYVRHKDTLYAAQKCAQTGRGTVKLELLEVWR